MIFGDKGDEIFDELGATDWQAPQLRYNCLLSKTVDMPLQELIPGVRILAQEGEDLLIELPSSSRDALERLHSSGFIPEPAQEARIRLLDLAQLDFDTVPDARRLFKR